MWTKREATEEGSALGELVDQVSLLTVQQSGSEGFCVLEMHFIHLWVLSFLYVLDKCGKKQHIAHSFPGSAEVWSAHLIVMPSPLICFIWICFKLSHL